jgi:hypothetical protein
MVLCNTVVLLDLLISLPNHLLIDPNTFFAECRTAKWAVGDAYYTCITSSFHDNFFRENEATIFTDGKENNTLYVMV